MKLFILFFLISSLSIIIIDGIFPLPTENDIENIIKGNQAAITGLPEIIKLSKGGFISREIYTIVWKGTYNLTTDVYIKITNLDDSFHTELEAYEKLNATNDDFDFEKYRIPRVYHNGTIFGDSNVVVMTWFFESLEKRFELQGGKFSDSALLLIFRQLAETLRYFRSRRVLHNRIEPKNILLRGKNVFIVNFRSSYMPNRPYRDYATMVRMIRKLSGADKYEIDSWILSSKYIKDPDVYKAFESIEKMRCLYAVENPDHAIPDFENIIKVANEALAEIAKKSEPVQFDWLKSDSHRFTEDSHGSTKDSHGSKKYSLGFFGNRFKRDSSGASSSSQIKNPYRRLNND